MPVRVMVDGTVERIGGARRLRVRRGDLLAVLRATPLATDRQARAADAATADRLASLATSRGDAAEERIQRIRADALRRELALLDEELGLTQVRAPANGMVLTPRLEERVGTSLAEGDQLLVLGRTDTLELELGVAQHDVLRIRPGQEVRLRVDALPSRTFEGRVTSVAQLPVGGRGGDVSRAGGDPEPGRTPEGRDGRARAGADRSGVHHRAGVARAGEVGPPRLVEALGVRRIALPLLLALAGVACSRADGDAPRESAQAGCDVAAAATAASLVTADTVTVELPSRCRPSSTSSTTPPSTLDRQG